MENTPIKEVYEVIDKNMPQMVGKILKDRLAQAETDALSLKLLKDSLVSAEIKIKNYESLDSEYKKITQMQKDFVKKETELATKIAVYDAKEQMWKERLSDNKFLVEAVFNNSKYKYMEAGQMPVAYSSGPNGCSGSNMTPYTKTITEERP